MDNETLSNLVKSNLDIPVSIGWFREDIKGSHITFTMLHEKPMWFSDNEPTAFNKVYEFDIWAINESPESYKYSLIELLENNNFTYEEGMEVPDKQPGLYHLSLKFSYFEEVIIND